MNNHLSDEQLAASALGESDKMTALHLQECLQCRGEIASLNGFLSAWVRDVAAGVGASDDFWRRQREAIAARLAPRPRVPWKNWAWATAALTLIVLAAMFYRPHPRPVSTPPADDNVLLLSVETSLATEVPEALEPVTLLTQEIDRGGDARPAKQETTHENGS
jgi:hypothetical protein